MPIRRLEKSYTGTTSTIGGDELAANTIPVKPHIQPGVLQPAVAGKLLDGTTSHSGAYGTAQSDGHSYYYTDIKGSKPIKDPRIGAHFGSQRHKTKSIQLLEQETATHNSNVYSVDGRDWLRTYGKSRVSNDDNGNSVQIGYDTAAGLGYCEIVGYFTTANLLTFTWSSNQYVGYEYKVDGGSWSAEQTTFNTAVNSPLGTRYVDRNSVGTVVTGQTLGIHTLSLKIPDSGDYLNIYGIELIVQDTTSTASKSQIQIPSQNVVSYGKKFSIPATAQHYNPFATKGDGSASTIPNNTTGDSVATGWAGSTSAYWDSSLDTATSLGLSAWESGGNYFRPVNGGRIVKWVDSSGTIKTSVNMMPPEAHASESTSTISSGAASGSVAPTGTHNWSTQNLPQFGNKTVGSNLWTSMTDNSSYVFDTRPSGGLNGAWANPSGYGLAYVSVTLTTGKLYRLRFDASSVSGVASYIGTASDSAASNWKNKSLITNGTNLTSVFRATATTPMIVMHTASGASAFTLANMTLFELEEPDSQAEVAKSFHFREFGNGAANQGSTTSGTLQDFSVLNASDNLSFVMDDGLTAIASEGATSGGTTGLSAGSSAMKMFLTFIGTGFSMHHQATRTWNKIAQNLPYGTHIIEAGWTDQGKKVKVDSVEVITGNDQAIENDEFTIFQPKMPPVPEDACILADYMLMADFVQNTVAGSGKTSKGTRWLSATRDVFYKDGSWTYDGVSGVGGNNYAYVYASTAASEATITAFATNVTQIAYDLPNRKRAWEINESVISSVTTNGGGSPSILYPTNSSDVPALGINKFGHDGTGTSTLDLRAFEIHTPIHTSSHYQTFETPFLHEMVGGDRNMEQNNLIVTPDGKSWDEVTRDTSYIGNTVVNLNGGHTAVVANNVAVQFKLQRGVIENNYHFLKKYFVFGFDRVICLIDGEYKISWASIYGTAISTNGFLHINGAACTSLYTSNAPSSSYFRLRNEISLFLKRGDYIQVKGGHWDATNVQHQNFSIDRLR